MLYIVVIFLFLSILLYLLMGGADFGAGVVELFTPPALRQRTRMITYRTIGPIWEANHMWLIIAIVILFVGFPTIYSTLSVHLHIPLLLMLIGIIGRGTAFIFRHYDAVKDDMQKIYNVIFMYSSFVTPFFLGVITGGMMSGYIDPEADSFYLGYIRPWLNWFSMAVGFFTVNICGFLAAVYLSGEVEDAEVRQSFIKKASVFNLTTVASGGLVFIAAEVEGLYLMRQLIADPVTLMAFVLASVSLFLLWRFLRQDMPALSRLVAGFQITMILFAVGYHYFPDLVVIQGRENLSLYNAMAPAGSINTLGWALVLGSIFILPALFYLIYSFQKNDPKNSKYI